MAVEMERETSLASILLTLNCSNIC